MHHSHIEALETRIAPAGLAITDIFVDATSLAVSLSNGLLKIAPKTGATNLDVSVELLPDGTFLISDGIGDDDLEETPNIHGLVRALSIGLSNGDDALSVALDSEYTLAGGVSISTGLGDDFVEISEGTIRGNVSLASKGTDEVTIGGGPVNIKGQLTSASVGGTFTLLEDAKVGVLNASGATDFMLGGFVVGNANLSAKVADTAFQIGGVISGPVAIVGGNLTISGAAGSDDAFVGHALVRGVLTLNLGAGNNVSTLSSDAVVMGLARINGTIGDDEAVIGSAGSAGPTIHGRLQLSLGAGNNSAAVRSGFVSGGFNYTGTTGMDTVLLGADLTLFADAKIAAGEGSNVIEVESFSSLWRFNLSTGGGTDTVTLTADGAGYVTGSVALGSGADTLTILGTEDFFTAFKVDGGLATDTITVSPLLVDSGLVRASFETVL
jgi:hypothetical protein